MYDSTRPWPPVGKPINREKDLVKIGALLGKLPVSKYLTVRDGIIMFLKALDKRPKISKG